METNIFLCQISRIINQQPQNEVENNPQDSTSKDDVSEENSGAPSSSSWWGGYSNWMDKAVNSVSSASVLGAEALTSVVETAKQKVKKPSCNHMSNQGCTLIVL